MFVELNLSTGKRIFINVNQINNFFESRDNVVVVCQNGEEDVFRVTESYEQVKEIITKKIEENASRRN
ncbi:MAG: hypothetical protein E6Q68_07890 [Polynucleobacter sp.]|nr:MAG: hypothetical protein E6Q68_07890 [Polynucleobacter sp.]